MKLAPTIHFNEFDHYKTMAEEVNGFQTVERMHPEFGSWQEKFLDLGHIKVYEHRADLKQNVNVHFDNSGLEKYVHHCMSVEGELAANFRDYNLTASLSPRSFHHLYLSGDEYHLGMGAQFLNVHIEVARDYYLNLLGDSEAWSVKMRQQILNNSLFYPGEFKLSLPMMQTIHSIFNSSMSGSLKKVLIEAKVLELVAMQLYSSMGRDEIHKSTCQKKELFFAIQHYLDDTFLEEHSLKNIARHFGINEFILKKGFKENAGTTVFDYILSKRLEYSLQLLQSTDQTITDIGFTIGYKYPNHFSSAFKKKFGINPTECRK